MLSFLVPVLFAFYLQGVLKFKCKIPAPKINYVTSRMMSLSEHLLIKAYYLKYRN